MHVLSMGFCKVQNLGNAGEMLLMLPFKADSMDGSCSIWSP